MKSRGKSGSPCLTPGQTEKKYVAKPLFNTHLDRFVQKVQIPCKKYVPKLNFSKTLTRKVALKESKAFSKSVATRITGLLFLFAYSPISLIVVITSY